jgi:hypothetical protein
VASQAYVAALMGGADFYLSVECEDDWFKTARSRELFKF